MTEFQLKGGVTITYDERKTQEERDRFKAALIALDRMADKLPLELKKQVQDVIYFDADLIFDADRMAAEHEARKGARSA